MKNTQNKRILLKLSGEVLGGKRGFGIDASVCRELAENIKTLHNAGLQIAIVIGGGNFFRGSTLSESGISRYQSDYIGMYATVMNSTALQVALGQVDVPAAVYSSVTAEHLAEIYDARNVQHDLEEGTITILAGGTGNPFFTTDSAAALRAAEISADLLLKATKVDGVYDADPVKNPDAKIFTHITFAEVLANNLRVMDSAAISLCRDNQIPIVVFNMEKRENFKKFLKNELVGTYVEGDN